MKKLTWDELTARINASTSVSEINRLNKKRDLVERETMREIAADQREEVNEYTNAWGLI